MPNDNHPAALANINSFAAVVAKDKQAWLELFADDAVVQDPVGVSGLDPTGLGHKGKEAIAGFWDMTIANSTIDFDVKFREPRGDECAVVAALTNRMADGNSLSTEMVVIYKVNEQGKIISLRAFWDYDGLTRHFEQQG